MRFVIELQHGPDGHVAGVVAGPDEGETVGFDGWLQLLRVLAAAALPPAAPPAEGAATEGFPAT